MQPGVHALASLTLTNVVCTSPQLKKCTMSALSKGCHKPPGSLLQRFLQSVRVMLASLYISTLDVISFLIHGRKKLDLEKIGQRTDQTVVLTGGTRGIGLEIVKKLLQLDYTIILGARNTAAGENAINDIRTSGITSGKVKLLPLDLSSLSSVRLFADKVLSSPEGAKIHVLLNNAGTTLTQYVITEDGFESAFQTNYLGHFLLTKLLLPRMEDTAKGGQPGYVVHTSSSLHRLGNIHFDDLEVSKVFINIKSYANSKLCLVMHAKSLEKMFEKQGTSIHAYACHPGAIPSQLWEDSGVGIVKLSARLLGCMYPTFEDGAVAVLHPMLNPDTENPGGKYFANGRLSKYNSQADKEEVRNELWARSEGLIQEGGKEGQGPMRFLGLFYKIILGVKKDCES